ncbi:hypothetical protein GALL_457350 [mine drainage metagenome]|uniref:Uncharacterized protein n=1 Tax=mine drainage metagenome TaxID=410659 RepID=A0A1J5PM62_9ZZZZ
MHIGDARIVRAGAVDADVIGVRPPTHGTDRVERKLLGFRGAHFSGLGLFIIIREDLLGGLDDVEHLDLAFLDDGVADDPDLVGHYSNKDGGKNRNDRDEACIYREMSHKSAP